MKTNTLKNNAILTATVLALTACGSGGNTLVAAPQAPTADEAARFAAGKVSPFTEINNSGITHSLTANGQTIMSGSVVNGQTIVRRDFTGLPQGFVTLSGTRYVTGGTYQGSYPVSYRSYQGLRSGVLVAYHDSDGSPAYADSYAAFTRPDELPAAGKATYQGTAFDRTEQGTLTYNVNFGAKTGSGRVEGLSAFGTINLASAAIRDHYDAANGETGQIIQGAASAARGQSMDYVLEFAGAKAEEIAGYAYNQSGDTIGMQGTRGAITE